jgi:hypothetical protein
MISSRQNGTLAEPEGGDIKVSVASTTTAFNKAVWRLHAAIFASYFDWAERVLPQPACALLEIVMHGQLMRTPQLAALRAKTCQVCCAQIVTSRFVSRRLAAPTHGLADVCLHQAPWTQLAVPVRCHCIPTAQRSRHGSITATRLATHVSSSRGEQYRE